MNNGKIAGMHNSDAEMQYPGLYYNTLKIDERYPEGESPIEFYERVKRNFETILNENKDYKNLMLVTHSGVINIIYYIVKNMNWSNKEKAFPIDNTSIHRLIIDGDSMNFDIENLKEHLNM